MIDLTGKVALVTGGASGIGAGISELLAKAGTSVVLGDIQDDAGAKTAARIVQAGGKATFVHHDVAVESQWEAAVGAAVKTYGGLDILVNNAGIEQTVFLADVDFNDMQKLLTVNIAGSVLGLKHAIRAMRPGGASGRGGSIINLSSVAGLIGTPGLGVYSASKGGVRLLTKAAAVECGILGYNIRVNSIHPALVETDMGNKLMNDFVGLGVFPDVETARKQHLASYPLGRSGTPTDIANAVLFLASDLSSWVTGTELVVDGGLSMC
jgi:NAD(P)-dependent dehydrogenase (short-subunit alcohol dehydrogenase family)